MALSPETTDALKQALDAVIAECGDDPQYADLVEHLQAAQGALPESEGDAEPRDAEDDDYSFETAEKRMTKRRAAGRQEA